VQLVGCDSLTISPALLKELSRDWRPLPQVLSAQAAKATSMERLKIDEKRFRWLLNEDAMATENLLRATQL